MSPNLPLGSAAWCMLNNLFKVSLSQRSSLNRCDWCPVPAEPPHFRVHGLILILVQVSFRWFALNVHVVPTGMRLSPVCEAHTNTHTHTICSEQKASCSCLLISFQLINISAFNILRTHPSSCMTRKCCVIGTCAVEEGGYSQVTCSSKRRTTNTWARILSVHMFCGFMKLFAVLTVWCFPNNTEEDLKEPRHVTLHGAR